MDISDSQLLTAYFENRETAQTAADDLRAAGISFDDLVLDDQSAGHFIESLKRLFGGEVEHEQYGAGTLLSVCGHRDVAIPILLRHGALLGSETAPDHEISPASPESMNLNYE